MAETIELRGKIDEIYDARAMKVNGTRIGAPYKKNLADVTTGGELVKGAGVVVHYSTRGQWKNAERIEVITAPGAALPAAEGVDPSEPGGKMNRQNPDYRHPDELNRVEALNNAVKILTEIGVYPAVKTKAEALVATVELAEMLNYWIENTVDAAFLKEQVGEAAPQTATEPAPEPKEPSSEAKAALEASAAPGPSAGATSALSSFING